MGWQYNSQVDITVDVPEGSNDVIGEFFSTAGQLASGSLATEAAITGWDGASDPDVTFPTGRICRVKYSCGAFANNTGVHLGKIRVRKTVGSITALQLASSRVLSSPESALLVSFYGEGYVVNATPADIICTPGLTVQLTAASTPAATAFFISGDSEYKAYITVEDVAPATNTALAAIAVNIV